MKLLVSFSLLFALAFAACAGTATTPAVSSNSGFSLSYEDRGSELPVRVTVRLGSDGAYERMVFRGASGGIPSGADHVAGIIPAPELRAIIDALVGKYDFFGMPGKGDESRPVRMDMSTEYLTVTWNGRTHKVGGYDARSCPEFRGVFEFVDGLKAKVSAKP